MTYTDIEKVKNYLGITVTTYDSFLSDEVWLVETTINSLLDIDWFEADTATETISLNEVYVYPNSYSKFILRNFNILTITQFDGSAYSGTKGLWDDYYIVNSREVWVKNFSQQISSTLKSHFSVTYTYGYASGSIPADILEMSKLMTAVRFRDKYPLYALWGTLQAQGIKSYKLADEQITFWDTKIGVDEARAQLSTFNASDETRIADILGRYKKANVFC